MRTALDSAEASYAKFLERAQTELFGTPAQQMELGVRDQVDALAAAEKKRLEADKKNADEALKALRAENEEIRQRVIKANSGVELVRARPGLRMLDQAKADAAAVAAELAASDTKLREQEAKVAQIQTSIESIPAVADQLAKKRIADGMEGLGQLSIEEYQSPMAAAMAKIEENFRDAQQRADDALADFFGPMDEYDKKMADAAAGIVDATRTPLEKFEATIKRLKEMLDGGWLNQEDYARAMKQAQDALDAQDRKTTPTARAPQSPAAVLANSAEAQRMAFEASVGVRTTKEDMATKQRDRTNTTLAKIEQNTREARIPAIA